MRNHQGFKQTEIGKIPKEWEIVPLKGISEINKESIDPAKEFPDHKFLYIDIDSVENETGVIRNAKEIIGKNAPSRARRLIRQNDVLMSTVRPYLKAFTIVSKEFHNQICSTGFAVLTCRGKVFPSYLFYSLFTKSVIDQCKKMMVGGQYPALNSSQVSNIKLSLPPLPEQKKIAEILSTVDQAIEKVDEATGKTQRLKNGLMQELLTKGIGHKDFKETETCGERSRTIGKIPKEWEVVSLRDTVEEIKNGFASGKRDEDGITQIRMNNVTTDGRLIFDSYLKVPIPENLDEWLLRKGDFLFNNTNSYDLVGKSTVFKDAPFYCTFSNHFTRIRFNKRLVLPELILYHFLILWQKGYFKSVAIRHVGQSAVHTDYLLRLQIPLPPLQEQQRIAEILSTVDGRLESLRNRKEKLGRIKKGLMNDLLTGKVRVTKLIEREVQDSSSLRSE